MTPAYKEALRERGDIGEPIYQKYLSKEKNLLESLGTLLLWMLSMMYEQLEWKVLLLWVLAFVLMSRVWSIYLGAFTLFIAVGIYLGEPYQVYYTIVFFFLIFVTLFSLLSHTGSSNSYSNSMKNDCVDIDSGDSDGGDA